MYKIISSDGTVIPVYKASPYTREKGTIIVLQEIFGVNEHIRSICDRLAKKGYVALAPSMFERIVPGFQSGYEPEEINKARAMLGAFSFETALDDIRAVRASLDGDGAVGVLGFCLGGSLAYASALDIAGVDAAVGFYGGAIVSMAGRVPPIPVQLHFGDEDKSIPMSDVALIEKRRPEIETFIYSAGHGFNCDMRASYEPESARLAWNRTLEFLERYLS